MSEVFIALSPATRPEAVLARIRHGTADDASGADVLVPLAVVGASHDECWNAAGPVTSFTAQGYDCTGDGVHLFFRRRDTQALDIEFAAETAYADLLQLTRSSGYPELLRIWNYFDDVTAGEGDAERYRRFSLGRHRALAAPGFERRLPAATVIGTHRPGLHLFGFASKAPGLQIENPRQTSAFRYPREYGPRSPSFSRATRYGDLLFVSGTAAIVGHETQHPNDAVRQVHTMLDNVRSLLAAAGTEVWRPVSLKLYVRDSAEADGLVSVVRKVFADDAPLLVLQGDVCRRDLVVEIEGVFQVSKESA